VKIQLNILLSSEFVTV